MLHSYETSNSYDSKKELYYEKLIKTISKSLGLELSTFLKMIFNFKVAKLLIGFLILTLN